MVLPQMLRRLHDRDRLPEFIDILQHRMRPSAVMTPPRLIGATASLLMRPGASRSQVLREVGELMRIEARRRRLMRHHEFVDTTLHADAGETEVPA
jgi:hypothetical protein